MAVRRAVAKGEKGGGSRFSNHGETSSENGGTMECERGEMPENDATDAELEVLEEESTPLGPQDVSETSDDSNAKNFSDGTRQERMRGLVDRLQTLRYACGNFVNHNKVQLFIVTLIAINALMMGIATFDFVRENPDVSSVFETVDLVFLIIFTVELGLQFVYYGWRLLLDGWLLFDLIVIITSWSFSSVQIIRAFRIFRALRLITRVKVMKNLVLGKF